MLDKQQARMLIDHNLPARMYRYENFRCFLNNLVIASGGNLLYTPPANDMFLEDSFNEQEKTKRKIKKVLGKAADAYGQLPFIVGQHDEQSDNKGNPFLGVSCTWMDLEDWKLKYVCAGVTFFEGDQTANNISQKIIEVINDAGVKKENVNVQLFDKAEAATGRIIKKEVGCAAQVCVDHSLGNAISYCTGKKKQKEKSSRFELNNTEGAALLKASTKQAKVFMKSQPKKRKLWDIQKSRIAAEF